MRKYVRISRHTITQLITDSYQEKINLLILNFDSIIRIYSYLFHKDNYIVDAKEFVNRIKSNHKYNGPLYNVFSNQD